MTGWLRTKNQTSTASCDYCADTGWVELIGTRKLHSYTYSRGTTACKFCELGLKRWQRMRDQHQPVTDDYTAADVDMPTPYIPASRADAKAAIAAIRATWAAPRLVGIDKVETIGDVQARIAAAREALDAEPEPDPEPEPFAPPADDSIPF